MKPDLRNLLRQGLISEKVVPQEETPPRRLLALTKSGYKLLVGFERVPSDQALYYGFKKPREALHDADLYRLYQKASREIEERGGKNLRVVLDYELHKSVYHDLAKSGLDVNSSERKQQVAEQHGLQVVRGKIPLPDMRIEYETPDGQMARVDLELATGNYRGSHVAEKVHAGFSIYADAQDAAGLRRILDQRELTAEILSL
jgi:DNA-binding PadR family transcriptional regulator